MGHETQRAGSGGAGAHEILLTTPAMHRREFLKTSAATLVAAAFLTESKAQQPAKKRALKKAVNLVMIGGPGSVADKFKLARDAGFDGLELNRPDAIPLDELLKAKAESGLEIAGLICSTHWGKPLSSPDPAVVEAGMKGLKLALLDAAELGCPRMLLVPGVVNKEATYDECWKRSMENIRKAIPDAEKAKCKIAVENVWNGFVTKAEEAVRYVDEIGSPWVGWHLDLGNLVNFEVPAENWVRLLGPHVFNLHIKDFSRAKREAGNPGKGFGVELGEGDNDWPKIMQALDEIGYAGYGILEVGGGDATRIKFLAERTSKLFAG